MTIRRSAAVIGAVAVGLATLAACDKPTPLAYLTAGTDSVHTDAMGDCYNDGDQISEAQVQKCLEGGDSDETITVEPGQQLRLGVDKKIADRGWYLAIDGRTATDPVEQTYRSYQADAFFQVDQTTGERPKSVKLSFVEGSITEGKYYGVWTFTVKMDD